MTTLISVQNVKKNFGKEELFGNMSFEVKQGDIIALFGPNGCGKSTLLNILTGVASADGGVVNVHSSDAVSMSYVFQNYRDSLLPWRTVFANISFPLEIKKVSIPEIKKKVQSLAEMFGVQHLLEKYPYQLSGGQQQVVAFMRALITEPKTLYIDEP